MLLVVIGYRQKGGVSKSRVGDILGLEASFYLDDLLSQGLIYCDPSRELKFWRPTPSALLALGLRSHTDIPALKELEEWFDSQKEIRGIAQLDPFFERTSKLLGDQFLSFPPPKKFKKGEIRTLFSVGDFPSEANSSVVEGHCQSSK